MALVVLLFLPVTLAGCNTADTEPTSPLPPPAPESAPIDVLHRSLVDEDSSQGEPQVALGPDGELYTYTRLGVARSDDGGRTWTDPVLPIAGLTQDQSVHASPDGTVWYAAMAYSFAGQAAARSDDRGETWTSHPAAMEGPVLDRPYIVGVDAETAFLAYHGGNGRGSDRVMATHDGGLTWSVVHTGGHDLSPTTPEARSFWFGDGILDAQDDALALPATWYSNVTGDEPCTGANCYRDWAPAALTSIDGAASWTWWVGPQGVGLPVGVQLVRSAFGPDGTLFLTWASVVDGDGAVWLSATEDGTAWTDPVRVDDGHGAAVMPNVAAGGDRVAITYYEADEPGESNGVSEAAAWNVTLVVLEPGTWDPVARGPLTEAPARYGPMCADGTSCTEDREFLDFFDMVALPDGRLGVVYNVLPRDGNTDLQNWFAVTAQPLMSGPAAEATLPAASDPLSFK